jgi:hypothetical protein
MFWIEMFKLAPQNSKYKPTFGIISIDAVEVTPNPAQKACELPLFHCVKGVTGKMVSDVQHKTNAT